MIKVLLLLTSHNIQKQSALQFRVHNFTTASHILALHEPMWNEENEKKLLMECEEKINAAIKEAESIKAPTFKDLFKNTFDEMPWFLKEELDELKKAYDGKMPEVSNKVEKIEGSFP